MQSYWCQKNKEVMSFVPRHLVCGFSKCDIYRPKSVVLHLWSKNRCWCKSSGSYYFLLSFKMKWKELVCLILQECSVTRVFTLHFKTSFDTMLWAVLFMATVAMSINSSRPERQCCYPSGSAYQYYRTFWANKLGP